MQEGTKIREESFKLLYSLEVGQCSDEEAAFWVEKPDQSAALTPKVKRQVQGTWDHRGDLDDTLKKYTERWEVPRMDAVDRAILRLATYELLFELDQNPLIILNDAIFLAKKYGTGKSPDFVNAILDKIYKACRKESIPNENEFSIRGSPSLQPSPQEGEGNH